MDVKIVDHSRRHNYQFLDVFPTLEAHMGTGGGNVPLILESSAKKWKPICVLATSCYDAPMTNGDVSPTLCARAGTGGNQLPLIMMESDENSFIFRRITPLECCRLQGFPDWWTDGVEGNDSAKYKMWGNGISLPTAADVLGRIAKEVQGWPVKTNDADAEASAK